MKAWTQLLEPGPAIATICFLLVISTSVNAAPSSIVPETITEIEYYPVADATGCYYNFQHYDEGDRIITNEPCLNCTCHNKMLMCYLRVCPFTKAIGADCTVEKRPDQCCPVISCPEVPVQLVTSTVSSTDVGHRNEYGCSIDGLFYSDGARVPSNPNNPCELCYCIRNKTACVIQQCTLSVDGCQPVYQEGVCCPVRYNCEHPEYLEGTTTPLLTTTTTTTTTTTQAPTTTILPLGCPYNGEWYGDGALIKKDVPCEKCYCMKGDVVCAVQECGPTPLDKINCTAKPPKEGQCCPDTYDCQGLNEEELTTISSYEATTTAIPIISEQDTQKTPELQDRLKPEEEITTESTTEQHTPSEQPDVTTESTKIEAITSEQPQKEGQPIKEYGKEPEKEGTEKPEEETTGQPQKEQDITGDQQGEPVETKQQPEKGGKKPEGTTVQSQAEGESGTTQLPEKPEVETTEQFQNEPIEPETEIPGTTEQSLKEIEPTSTEQTKKESEPTEQETPAQPQKEIGLATTEEQPRKETHEDKTTEQTQEGTEHPPQQTERSEQAPTELQEETKFTTQQQPEKQETTEEPQKPSEKTEQESTERSTELTTASIIETITKGISQAIETLTETITGKPTEEKLPKTTDVPKETEQSTAEEPAFPTHGSQAVPEQESSTEFKKPEGTEIPTTSKAEQPQQPIEEQSTTGIPAELSTGPTKELEATTELHVPEKAKQPETEIQPEATTLSSAQSSTESEKPKSPASEELQPVTEKEIIPEECGEQGCIRPSIEEQAPEQKPTVTEPSGEQPTTLEIETHTELPKKTELPESMNHVIEKHPQMSQNKPTEESTTTEYLDEIPSATKKTTDASPVEIGTEKETERTLVEIEKPTEQPTGIQKTGDTTVYPKPEVDSTSQPEHVPQETTVNQVSPGPESTEKATTEIERKTENPSEEPATKEPTPEENEIETEVTSPKIQLQDTTKHEEPTATEAVEKHTTEPAVSEGQTTQAEGEKPIVPEVCAAGTECAPVLPLTDSETVSKEPSSEVPTEVFVGEGTTETNKIPEEHPYEKATDVTESNAIPESSEGGVVRITPQPETETEESSGETPIETLQPEEEGSGAEPTEGSGGVVTTESATTEQKTEHPAEKVTTTQIPPRVIPGEGSCLHKGVTYDNNSQVPPINPCQISCKCVNSELKCETDCPPPPAGQKCMPIFASPESCCPEYQCVETTTTSEEGLQTTAASISDKIAETTEKQEPETTIPQELQPPKVPEESTTPPPEAENEIESKPSSPAVQPEPSAKEPEAASTEPSKVYLPVETETPITGTEPVPEVGTTEEGVTKVNAQYPETTVPPSPKPEEPKEEVPAVSEQPAEPTKEPVETVTRPFEEPATTTQLVVRIPAQEGTKEQAEQLTEPSVTKGPELPGIPGEGLEPIEPQGTDTTQQPEISSEPPAAVTTESAKVSESTEKHTEESTTGYPEEDRPLKEFEQVPATSTESQEKVHGEKSTERPQEGSESTERTEIPKKGTESPKEGTESPKEGTESPKEGTESPIEGFESPQEGTVSPKENTEGPKESTEGPKESPESPKESTEIDMEGTKSPQEGPKTSSESYGGTETPKEGTESSQEITESPKIGTESHKEGTNIPKEGTESPKEVTESPKEGTESPKEGTESSKEGTESPKGSSGIPEKEQPEETTTPENELVEKITSERKQPESSQPSITEKLPEDLTTVKELVEITTPHIPEKSIEESIPTKETTEQPIISEKAQTTLSPEKPTEPTKVAESEATQQPIVSENEQPEVTDEAYNVTPTETFSKRPMESDSHVTISPPEKTAIQELGEITEKSSEGVTESIAKVPATRVETEPEKKPIVEEKPTEQTESTPIPQKPSKVTEELPKTSESIQPESATTPLPAVEKPAETTEEGKKVPESESTQEAVTSEKPEPSQTETEPFVEPEEQTSQKETPVIPEQTEQPAVTPLITKVAPGESESTEEPVTEPSQNELPGTVEEGHSEHPTEALGESLTQAPSRQTELPTVKTPETTEKTIPTFTESHAVKPQEAERTSVPESPTERSEITTEQVTTAKSSQEPLPEITKEGETTKSELPTEEEKPSVTQSQEKETPSVTELPQEEETPFVTQSQETPSVTELPQEEETPFVTQSQEKETPSVTELPDEGPTPSVTKSELPIERVAQSSTESPKEEETSSVTKESNKEDGVTSASEKEKQATTSSGLPEHPTVKPSESSTPVETTEPSLEKETATTVRTDEMPSVSEQHPAVSQQPIEKATEPQSVFTSPPEVITTTSPTPGRVNISLPDRTGAGEPYTSGPSTDYTTKAAIEGELSTSAPLSSESEFLPITTSTYHPGYPSGEPEVPGMYPTGGGDEEEYVEEPQPAFGPGTCRYGGKVYVSAQQIPRDDPCDFCFCFRSDIICLQQSCPPPIPRCHEEPIRGFCCPRYECPVSMATALNLTTSTTTTTTTLPPHFFSHAYKGRASKTGCQIQGRAYKVGEVIRSTSGPCLNCTCGGDGQMQCDPKACSPEPMLRQMIAAAASKRRR